MDLCFTRRCHLPREARVQLMWSVIEALTYLVNHSTSILTTLLAYLKDPTLTQNFFKVQTTPSFGDQLPEEVVVVGGVSISRQPDSSTSTPDTQESITHDFQRN